MEKDSSKKKKNKEERVEVLMQTEHLKKIDEKAGALGMKRGPFMLYCALNARIDVKIGSDPTASHMRSALDMFDRGLITKKEFMTLKKRIFDDDAHGAFKSLERRFKKESAENREV